WDSATGKELQVLRGHNGSVFAAAFNANGQRLATCAADNTVRLWDPRGGGLLQVLRGTTAGTLALQFTPDGNRLLGATADGPVRVWDLLGAESIPLGSFAEVLAMQPRPGKALELYCAGAPFFLWQFGKGARATTAPAPPPNISGAALAASGTHLATMTLK